MNMKWLLLALAVFGSVFLLGAKAPEKAVVLLATDDAYVVTDTSITEDPEGLRDKNYGALDFIKVWYAWKVQKDEQLLSVGMAKFDLSTVKDRDIQSATLQLFAMRADLAQPARLVDVHEAAGDWSEKDVTFANRLTWSTDPIATGAVYGAGVWYSWDVSGSVMRLAKDGKATYVLGLRTVEDTKEEQVVFASHEVGQSEPRLIVTYRPEGLWGTWYGVGGVVGAAAIGAAIAFVLGMRIARRGRREKAAST